MGAQVLGISVNKPEANRSFAEKLGLTFPLLSDTRTKVCRQYGVLSFWRVAKRTTFVIDSEGIIRHIDRGSEAMNPARARQALPSPSTPPRLKNRVESAYAGDND